MARQDAQIIEKAELTMQVEGDVLQLRAVGAWQLHLGLPAIEDIDNELQRVSQLKQVAFVKSDISDWDSGIIIFLMKLNELCRQKQIALNYDGLPRGVQRLFALATAVPEKTDAKQEEEKKPFLEMVGEQSLAIYKMLVDVIEFIGLVTIAFNKFLIGKAKVSKGDWMLIAQQCGAQALPIVSLVTFLMGLIIAFIGALELTQFGAGIYVADLVSVGMARELGAMMTAIIMAGRTGAAFAAQLGTMTVNEEIDALVTWGISPIESLVLPRIIAFIVMMPLLVLYADLMGILGGAVVGVGMLDFGVYQYYLQTVQSTTLVDFSVGIVKGIIYGSLVVIAGCMRGLQCGKSSQAVGEVTTSAVVMGIVFIIVSSAILNVLTHVLGI